MAETSKPGNTPDKADESAAKTTKLVKYVGTADVAEITAAQWAKIGVEDQKKVVWSDENGHTVPEADFTKQALAYFEKDSRFKLTEA